MTVFYRFLMFIAITVLPLEVVTAQYHFSGAMPKGQEGKKVYLSLIENYRKVSRSHADQILDTAYVNTNGRFIFRGKYLPQENRLYRIHTDECDEKKVAGTHFFKNCDQYQSVLFIANNQDTLSLPLLGNDQPLCSITSTNNKASLILQLEELKEAMSFDFLDFDSAARQKMKFKKWFSNFQEFGRDSNEPLVALCVYDFLSDRGNETYPYYKNEVLQQPFYDELLQSLRTAYPNAAFTEQYAEELHADRLLVGKESPKNLPWAYFILGGCAFALVQLGYSNLKKRPPSLDQKANTLLSAQENKIYGLLKKGHSNKEIAAQLFISISTVKTHTNSIYKKLDIPSREALRKNN